MCNRNLATLTTLAAGGAALFATGGAAAPVVAGAAGSTAAAGAAAGTTAAATSLTTAQIASLGLGAAGAGLTGFGLFTQAQAAQKAASANAREAELRAQDALKRGEKDAQELRRRGSVLQGQQRTALAARGLDLSEGTPASILGQSDFFTQVDQATARNNARREAAGARTQGANFQAEADAANPGLSLAGSLLGGGARVADKWFAFSRPARA